MDFENCYADRLAQAIEKKDSRLVVGIDPRLDRLPEELTGLEPEDALLRLGSGVIEAIAEDAAAVKPQIAFFERWGWRGWRALEGVCQKAREQGLIVILDAKRGDIGSTASAYAEALLGTEPGTPGPHVDALTINPYLGSDSLEPFLERVREGGRGLYVLARTSNPGGAEFQKRDGDADPIFLQVARTSEQWGDGSRGECGYHGVGLVVGATHPEEISKVRECAPGASLLIPGVGAQGGSVEDLGPAFDSRGLGALVNSSRGVVQAFEKQPGIPWQEAVQQAARETREQLQGAITS